MGSTSKRSRSRSPEASTSQSRSHQSKRRRASSQAKDTEATTSTLSKLLEKVASIGSIIEQFNDRLSFLESSHQHRPTSSPNLGNVDSEVINTRDEIDNTVVAGDEAEDNDSLERLSVSIQRDPELESVSPETLDPNCSHKCGNLTSKALTQSHVNDNNRHDMSGSLENNNDNGRIDTLKDIPILENANRVPFDPLKGNSTSWSPSSTFQTFLETNFRRSLSSSQIFNILEETSLPDTTVFTAPKLDKAIGDQIQKNYKKTVENRDKELMKVQRHILNVGAPLSALHDLLENKQDLSHEEIMNLVERALCLLGNASNSMSILRRSKILYSINPSKISLAEAAFLNAGSSLFGTDISKIAADSAVIARNLQKNLTQSYRQSSSTWPKPQTQFRKYQ